MATTSTNLVPPPTFLHSVKVDALRKIGVQELRSTASLQESLRERRDELGRALHVGVEWKKKFNEAYETAEDCLKSIVENRPKKQKTSRSNNSNQE